MPLLVSKYLFMFWFALKYQICACRNYLSSLKAHHNFIIFLEKKLSWHPYRFLCVAKGTFVSAGKDKRCCSDISATQINCVIGGGITCSTELPCETAKK